MQRTISLKIEAPTEFLDYLKTCNKIFNKYVEWCFDTKSYNKNKAHIELYDKFRQEYQSVNSGTIQCVRDTALESVKALKFKFRPFKKPTSHVRYDKRTISLRGDQLSFAWSGDRIKQIIKLPKFFKDRYADWKFQSATIGYDKLKKSFKANLIFQALDIEKQGEKVVGVDRGLYNIVSLSDGQLYKANQIRKKKREFLYVKRQLQAKGTLSAKRLLRKRSGKEKRFSLYQNHCISKWLANQPYDIFVLEDLKGIRKQRKGKKLNGWLSNWTFYQLEQLLTYKAAGLGKRVVKVDARYTSQKCFVCGKIEKKNRNKSQYKCSCGYREHADINAAKNIRSNYTLSAAEKPAEQAACKSAECLGKPETKPTTSVVG